jgi:amino acid transporter
MILAPPAGDAFNFIVDLQSYPNNIFLFALTIGLLLIRRSRKKLGLGSSEADFKTWDVAIYFSIAVNVFLLVMPWYPPPKGRNGGDVSFWYATYCAVGVGIMGICVVYYVAWIFVLPRWGGYRIRQELVVLEGEGAKTHRLVKVKLAELESWDREHDVVGQRITTVGEDSDGRTGNAKGSGEKGE